MGGTTMVALNCCAADRDGQGTIRWCSETPRYTVRLALGNNPSFSQRFYCRRHLLRMLLRSAALPHAVTRVAPYADHLERP